MKKRLTIVFLITFFMFIGINKVSATTCEYEMYPTYYVYDATNNKFMPKRTYMGQENGKYIVTNNAKLRYTIDEIDKNNYTLEHIIMFDGTTNKTFKENSFNNDVWNNNKNSNGLHDCPKYVSVTKDSISEIPSASEFARQQQTFDSLESYPMILVKQNSTVKDAYAKIAIKSAFEDIDDYINQITTPIKNACGNNYTNLITASNYGLDYQQFGTYVASNERQTRDLKLTDECWRARKTYYSQISQLYNTTQEYINRLKESSVTNAEEISQNTNGYTNLNSIMDKLNGASSALNKIENNNAKITKYSSSYCAGYCELIQCATASSNATAYEYCMRNCDDNNNTCTIATERCQNISDSSAQNACYEQNNFDNGSYSNTRLQTIQNLENENRNLEIEVNRYRTSVSSARDLDVEINVYRLQCDDVSMLHTIWVVIWVAAPALLIVMGTWDFASAVIAGDEEKMKKSKKRFPKRIIAFFVLVLTPILITLIVNLSTNSDINDTSLMYCIVNGGE